MSRIGKKPVKLNTAKVSVKDNNIEVSGSKGTMIIPLFRGFKVNVKDDEVEVVKENPSNSLNASWGLLRSLLQNAVTGLEEGFEKRLEMIGVGYRASKSGKKLSLNVGYSHPIEVEAPEGIEFEVEENTKIIIRGYNKELVGRMAAKIRSIRKPEPYKGKGIKYEDEIIRRKAGKSGKAAE